MTNNETAVFAYYWGFGPIRWAFTRRQALADRRAVVRHSSQEGLPGPGPLQEMLLEELPPEAELRLYVGA
jgi:hypothetical protein